MGNENSKDDWQRKAKEIAALSGTLSLLAAIIGLVTAYLQVLILSRGHIGVAHFIINEVGAMYFWSGALLALMSSFILAGAAWAICAFVVMLKKNTDNDKEWFAQATIMCLSLLVLLTCVSVLGLILAIAVAIYLCYSIMKYYGGNIKVTMVAKSIFYALISLIPLTIMQSSNLFLTNSLTLKDGTKNVVKVIADKDS